MDRHASTQPARVGAGTGRSRRARMTGTTMSDAVFPFPDRVLLRSAKGRPLYRLVCLHHAGAGASAYAPWMSRLPQDVELCAVRLPGRESRMGQAPHRSPASAVAEVVETLEALLTDGLPWALYGHSMGGLLAYEVQAALIARGVRPPLCLALGATGAPQRRAAVPPRLPQPYGRADLVDVLRSYGGTPQEVFEHRELLDLILPVLAADLTLFDSYVPVLPPAPVRCPLLAFAGAQDSMVEAADVAEWEACATGGFEYRLLDAGHFFVGSHADEVITLLDASARAAVSV
ncbi:thioesterase II family protein [Streptomyces sp. BE230]|uniref:thioesterase II family protein n=1 Tax=Streptomyces sp. BE230 TaxID=3002526 RepID=UPI002ED5CAB0|nr:alpha/beta fold hydrolase [Streptomyces sp. BE230]